MNISEFTREVLVTVDFRHDRVSAARIVEGKPFPALVRVRLFDEHLLAYWSAGAILNLLLLTTISRSRPGGVPDC
jgi:hypothetical protein